MDFTVKTYQELLDTLVAWGYSFQSFADFLNNPKSRTIILRHDVDTCPQNSLQFSQIENKNGIRGSYYFRIVPKSFNKDIILQISSLNHEIGYHYETMDTSSGDIVKAKDEFCRNLEKFREISPIHTICMHGSPLSKFDNRDLWKKYNYHDYGIIGEPYFDLDFSRVLYLTDTGRRWDGGKVSVRDKVGQLDSQQSTVNSQRSAARNINSTFNIQHSTFHSTSDIITAANSGLLPDQIMLTFHPQRWTDKPLPWLQEMVWQNAKNVVKKWIVRRER